MPGQTKTRKQKITKRQRGRREYPKNLLRLNLGFSLPRLNLALDPKFSLWRLFSKAIFQGYFRGVSRLILEADFQGYFQGCCGFLMCWLFWGFLAPHATYQTNPAPTKHKHPFWDVLQKCFCVPAPLTRAGAQQWGYSGWKHLIAYLAPGFVVLSLHECGDCLCASFVTCFAACTLKVTEIWRETEIGDSESVREREIEKIGTHIMFLHIYIYIHICILHVFGCCAFQQLKAANL